MAGNYWIKLYTEILHDPKMARMNDHLWRRTIELFCMAGELHQEGLLPPIEDIAWTFRTSTEQLESDLIELQKYGILIFADNQWIVRKFAERQSPSQAALRMRKYREKLQLRNVTRNVKIPETETDTDTEHTVTPLVFENAKNHLEQLTGILAVPQSIKAINEIVEMGASSSDIDAAYQWFRENAGKPLKYYGQLVGPTRTAMSKRLGNSRPIPEDPRNIATEVY